MNRLPSRPIVSAAVIMLCCGFIILHFGDPLGIIAFAMFMALSVVFLVLFILSKTKAKRIYAIFCVSFLLGAAVPYLNYIMFEQSSSQLIELYDGNAVEIKGKVLKSRIKDESTNLVLQINEIDGRKLPVPLKALTFYYEELNADENYLYTINAILEPVTNYSDFDNITYRKSDKIFINVINDGKITLQQQRSSFSGFLNKAIFKVLKINVVGKEYPVGSIANALVTGDKSALPKGLSSVFSKSGMSHVLCVSGLHIAVIISFVHSILLSLKINSKYGYMFICATGVIYMFVASFSPSVYRAVIVVVIMYFGLYFKAKADALNSLCVAAIILFVVNPYNIFDIGAQLSFMASLGLLFSTRATSAISRLFSKRKLVCHLLCNTATCFFAIVFTLPVTCVTFGQLSLVSVAANVCLVPVVSIILPMLLLSVVFYYVPGITLLSRVLGYVSGFLIELVCDCAYRFSKLHYAIVPTSKHKWYIIAFFACIALILFIHSYSKRKILILTAIPIFIIFAVISAMSAVDYYKFYNDSKIHYFRSYYSEALTLKASENRFLYISLSEDILKNDICYPMLDETNGQNWFFPAALLKYSKAQLAESINKFEQSYGIKYLCLYADNDVHKALYEQYKNSKAFDIILIKDSFSFGQFDIKIELNEKSEFFEIREKDSTYALLKANKTSDFGIPAKHYKSFVFSPLTNTRNVKNVNYVNSDRVYSTWYSDEEYYGAVNLRKIKFVCLDD